MAAALTEQAAELRELASKYIRHGFLVPDFDVASIGDTLSPTALDGLARQVAYAVDPTYSHEWSRAVSLYRILAAGLEEAEDGRIFQPRIPGVVVPGESYSIADGDSAHLLVTMRLDESGDMIENNGGELSIPPDAKPGDHIALVIQSGDADHFSPYYQARIPVTEAVSLVGLPDKIVMGDEDTLTVTVRNNLLRGTEGNLRLYAGDALTAPAPELLALEPGEERQHVFTLAASDRPESADSQSRLRVSWTSTDAESAPFEEEIPLTILSRNASLLRTSDVRVRVDSFYFGYDEEPLTDGVIDTAGLDWKQAAWASEEGAVPHWVEFDFAAPRELREVAIYWAQDGGSYWTSSDLRVEVKAPGESSWRPVAQHQDAAPQRESRLTFDPVEVKSLRLYQPVGGGPSGRSGILWLSEVEAR
jgi:hypothetical protein